MSPPSSAALVPALRERRVTVFAGAGISMIAPSCLPSWWQLNHAVLDALAGQAAEVTSHAAAIIEGVKHKQAEGRMPPEYTSEVIVNGLAEDYFEVLRCLEGERFNAVHAWLATLARARRLPAIVTTNFDTLIERACEVMEVPLRVLVTEADYTELDVEAHLLDPQAPVLLLKLHGTATEPTTCLDTLAQRKRGLPTAVGVVLQAILRRTRLCLLGYSGADLEAEPNYLYLRQMAAHADAPGFCWLALPDATVPDAVQALVDHYGDPQRGYITRGTLPGWLDGWIEALDGTDLLAPSLTPEPGVHDERARQEHDAEAQRTLERRARAWGAEQGPLSAAVLVGTFADDLPYPEVLAVYQQLLDWGTTHAPGTRLTAIAHLRYGVALRRHHRADEALEHNTLAREIVEAIGATDVLDDVLGQLASIHEDRGELDRAEPIFREALALSQRVDPPQSTIDHWLDLARVVAALGRLDEAVELLDGAYEVVVPTGFETARADVLERRAIVQGDLSRNTEALASLREAAQVRRRLGQAKALGYNLCHQATARLRMGQYAEATSTFEQALDLAEQTGSEELRATISLHRASLYEATGDLVSAAEALRSAMATFERLDDPQRRIDGAVSLVGVLATRGQLAEAIAEGTRTLAEAAKIGLVPKLAQLHCNLGIAYELSGHDDAAIEHYERARTLGRRVRDPRAVMLATGNLANVHYRQGALDPSEAEQREVIEMATALGDHPARVRALGNLGNLALSRSEFARAEQMFRDAIALAEEHGLMGITGQTHINLGRALLYQETIEGADEILETALQLLQAQGDTIHTGYAAWDYTRILLMQQRYPEAKQSVELALACWVDHPLPEREQAESILQQLVAAGIE